MSGFWSPFWFVAKYLIVFCVAMFFVLTVAIPLQNALWNFLTHLTLHW